MDGAAPPPRSGSLPQGHHLSSMSSASGRFLDDLLNEYNYPSAAHSPVLSRSASSQLEPGDSQTPTATEPEHSQGDGGPPKNDLPPLPVNSFGARTDSLRFPPATSPPTSPLPKPPSHPQVPIAVGTQPPKSPNVTQTYPSYRSLERTHMPSEYPTSPHHLNDASHMPRTRARAPSANEPDLSLSARTLPDGQADPKGWLRTPNLRVNLQKRSSDDVATTNDRVKTHSTTGSSITALDHESRDALAMGLNSVPSIPSPEESFGASVAGSIHSKNSISPPKSARSYLSASSPNTASTKSAPYEQSTLTAERWNSDASREKKKGFISHLFGRKKEKSRETDSASDSGPINVRGADRHTPGSDAIDIGNIKAWEDATLGKPIPSFGKKKGAKVQSSTKADKRPQLDLSGFSMDPSFVPLDLVSINSPLSPASARSPYSNSPIGYAHNPAVLPAPLAPPCGPFGAPPPGPSIYLSPATSTWKPPESWGTKVNAAEGRPTGSASAFNGSNKGVLMDRTTTKSIPSLGAPSPDVFDYQDDYSTLSEIRAETDTIRSNHDGLSDERMVRLLHQ
ncbi:hypothetical protein DFJ77DRAFT_21554 [Powellomyces hirtus]|nr:hypothetical protein DFJ77DRAFT_21554 [Powellomyces hirtus]